MTSFRWPLGQVRLEGGRLLSEIVTWCSEHGESVETIWGLMEFGRIHIVILSDGSSVCHSTPSSSGSSQI